MEYNFTICPSCKISVGFLSCVTCSKQFNFFEDFCPKYYCPCCENKPRLKCFVQQANDGHERCWKNLQRMYYWCEECSGHFCPCIEKKSSPTVVLKPCPFKKKQNMPDNGIIFGFQ